MEHLLPKGILHNVIPHNLSMHGKNTIDMDKVHTINHTFFIQISKVYSSREIFQTTAIPERICCYTNCAQVRLVVIHHEKFKQTVFYFCCTVIILQG